MEDGKLHTPLADCFLNGITRQTVIEMAAEKGVEVVERHMEPEELGKVKECFLTGTAAEVTPVSQIGEYHFKPDALTREFVQGYADLVNGC
jgi:branched-chain amino acid aminotransferase